MRAALVPASLLLLLATPALAQSRRVVAVCPSVVADDVDRKIAQSVDAWVHDALIARKIARVDPALMKAELEIFDDRRCPQDEKARLDFARSLRASDVLVVRIFYPAVIAGSLHSVEGKTNPNLPVIRPEAGKAVTAKSAREAINAFIASLPIDAGEALIEPLVQTPPPDNGQTATVTPPAVTPPPAAVEPPKPSFRLTGAALGAYGVGAAAAVGGAASFWFAMTADNQFDALAGNANNTPADEARLQTLQDEGRMFRIIGSVALGVAGAAVIAGTVLGFTAPLDPAKPSVSLGAGPGSLVLSGTF